MGKYKSSSASESDYQQLGFPSSQVPYENIYSPTEDNTTQPRNQPNSENLSLSVNGAPRESYIAQKYSWWSDVRRNRPQSRAFTPASFILISGGMSLTWSIISATGLTHMSQIAFTHMLVCWFVGVIIGACIAAVLIEKITMRILNIIASVLVIVNGILIVAMKENTTAVIVARYCDGIAFGLTLIPAIVIGSELSVKRFRAFLLSIEQICIVGGMIIFVHFLRSSPHPTHGVLAIIYGALALIFIFIFDGESPVSYLRKGNEAGALHAQSQLQGPKIVTDETHALLAENKRLVEEDIARGRALNVSIGLIPLIKLCLFRTLVTMSFSLPIAWASALTGASNVIWILFPFVAMRGVGVFISAYLLDIVGRKRMSGISLLVGGGLIFAVGILFKTPGDTLNVAMGLLLAYQIFSGLSAPASTCYLGEAFSISMKPYFILAVILFENIIQIIIFSACGTVPSIELIVQYVFVLSAFQIVFGIYFFFGMPETKQTILREALALFAKIPSTEPGV